MTETSYMLIFFEYNIDCFDERWAIMQKSRVINIHARPIKNNRTFEHSVKLLAFV